MHPLRNRQLLSAWEAAGDVAELERGPALLAASNPGTTAADWSNRSLAEMNLNLLRLRQMTFGPKLMGYMPCPNCGVRLTFQLDIPRLIVHLERTTVAPTVSMRSATTDDLRAIQEEADPLRARRALLARCGADDGVERDESELTKLFNRVNEPAEILCQCDCVECGESHGFDLNIGRFLWMEVRRRAMSLMRDVSELAAAFGWSEESILAMSDRRREAYLETVQS